MTPSCANDPHAAGRKLDLGSEVTRSTNRSGRSRSLRLSLILALGSGLLFSTLFPPLSWHLLAWVCLVPLLVATSLARRPAGGAICGLVFGFTVAVGIYWWFPNTLSGFFGLPSLVSWVLGLLAGLVVAAPYVGLSAALSWLMTRRSVSPLLVVAGWVAAELLTVHGLLPNAMNLIAYTQTRSGVVQLADLAGPYGVAVPIVAVNAVVAGLVAPRLRPRYFSRWLAGVLLLVVGTFAYGAWRRTESFGEGPELDVALVQGSIPELVLADGERRSENVDVYVKLTRGLARETPDLVLWPEFALVEPLSHPTAQPVFELSEILATDLLLGAPHLEQKTNSEVRYNSVFLLRSGAVVGRYDKGRLLPFAEMRVLGRTRGENWGLYSPGESVRVVSTRPGTLGVLICSEVAHPAVARQMTRLGAVLLANPSNDFWLGHLAPARLQLQIAALRAIENRRYLARPTTTGFTAILDPHGHTKAELGIGDVTVLRGSLRPSTAVTGYHRFGELPALAFSFLFGMALLAARRRRAHPQPSHPKV